MSSTPKHAAPTGGQADIYTYSPTQQMGTLPQSSVSYEEYKKYERNSWQHGVSMPKKKKMGAGKKVLVVILVLLLLFGVGAGAYIWNLNKVLGLSSSEHDSLVLALSDKKSDGPFYVLCLGSDKREIWDSNERSDVTLLVRVDAKNKLISMLSIPRDTPYTKEDGTIDRINTAYRDGGAAAAVRAVSGLTGLPISHYAEIRISEFEALIDDLGGIDFDVPYELTVKDVLTREWVTLEPGLQHINGQQAQILARDRKDHTEGDVTRQSINRQIIIAILESALSRPAHEIPGAVMKVASHIDTDMNVADILALVRDFGTDFSDITFYSATGPIAGGWRDDLGGEWICYDNPEGWKLVVEALDAGEDPSTIDVNEYAIIPEQTE